MSALGTLLPATWRGVTFGVRAYVNNLSRRYAVHDYPYRDDVWVEDLGSGRKQFSFRGFLNGPLAAVQHAAMLLAVDTPGLGTLTHPGLGVFQGAVTQFSSEYSAEEGGVYSLDITFIQSSTPMFPGAVPDGAAQIGLGSLNVLNTSSAWFTGAISAIGIGAAAITAMPAIVNAWAALPSQLIGDAQTIASNITGLGDAFGPYARGSGAAASALATPASLGATAFTSRTAAIAAVTAAQAAAATGVAASVATAVQAVLPALRAAIAEPTEQMRALLAVAAYAPAITASTDAVDAATASAKAATAALCQYATLAELARAAAAYNFRSFNEASSVSTQIANVLSAGILQASNARADQVCQALRLLRGAVVQHLATVGATLAPLRTVTFPAPLPALAVAQRLYQDGRRSSELIRNALPWHPAFMPQTMTVVAA